MVGDWIIEANLHPFIVALGWFVGYAVDDDDWTAIRLGVEATVQEADRWYEYEFAGKHRASFWLARDPGSSVVHVRVEVSATVVPKVEAALSIFQYFRIRVDAC